MKPSRSTATLLRGPARRVRSLALWAGHSILDGIVRLAAGRTAGAVPPESPESVLVLRNNDLGDLLVVTPLFDALRRRFPEAWIVAGVGSSSLDVLRHNPFVSEAVPVDAPWFNRAAAGRGPLSRARYVFGSAQGRELARRRFDLGIDVLGSSWGALLLVRAGIAYRVGVRGYAGGNRVCHAVIDYDPSQPVGRAALRFAELLGASDLPEAQPQIFLAPEESEEAETAWRAMSPGDGRGLLRLVLAPGAGLPEKRWPLESFLELAHRLTRHEGVRIAVVGGPEDRIAGERLAAVSAAIRSFCGDPSVRRTFGLLAGAHGAITNSSMVLHAAAAFSKPTLTLLGPSFLSVKTHDAQWGHPEAVTLGPEPGTRPGIATVAEATAAARRLFLRPGGPVRKEDACG